VGQVLFNDVVQKLGVLESDYFDLEYLDIHGVHVSTLYTGMCVCVCVYSTLYASLCTTLPYVYTSFLLQSPAELSANVPV